MTGAPHSTNKQIATSDVPAPCTANDSQYSETLAAQHARAALLQVHAGIVTPTQASAPNRTLYFLRTGTEKPQHGSLWEFVKDHSFEISDHPYNRCVSLGSS